MSAKQVIFTTERLLIRAARLADAEVLYRLWTDPQVMIHVGFPHGLDISRQEIIESIHAQDPETEFTIPVAHYIYRVRRSDWEQRRHRLAQASDL